MNNRRTAKMSQAIREQVSSSILFDVKDPRVQNVTVIDVEMSADLQHARIFLSVMGDEATQKLCLHGLNSARGFLQSKVADRLQAKYTPILSFVLDDGVKRSFEATKLLEELEEAEKKKKSIDLPQDSPGESDLSAEHDKLTEGEISEE